MVPDLMPPTDEIAGLCHAVVDSLHDVGVLVLGAAGAPTQ